MMSMRAILKSLNSYLEYLAIFVLLVTLPTMLFAVGIQVVLRYSIGMPIFWIEELSRYLMVWSTFFGADLALRRNQHVTIQMLIDCLSPRHQRYIEIVVSALIAAFAFFVLYYGFALIRVVRETNQVSPALGVSMVVPYLAIPLAAFSTCVHALGVLVLGAEKP